MTSPAGMARACSAWSTRSCMLCASLPVQRHGTLSRDYAGAHQNGLLRCHCLYLLSCACTETVIDPDSTTAVLR